MRCTLACCVFLLALPMLDGCAQSTAPALGATPATSMGAAPVEAPATTPATAAPVVDVAVPGGASRACNRVTASEMSAIVGMPMAATPNDDAEGITSCSYAPLAGKGPSIEYTISAGDGASTLSMGREMKNYDPAPGKAFAGIGDDADVIGPALVINDHGDMVSLYLGGIRRDDEPAVAKKIYDASRP